MYSITRWAAACMLVGAAAPAAAQPAGLTADADALARTCVPSGQHDRPMANFSPAERIALVSCAQREVARQLNAQLPRQIDDLTLLHVITTEGAQLTYHFKLAVDAKDINAAQRANLVQTTRAHVCRQADMRQTMSLGGSYAYVWIDPGDIEIARTVIEAC